MYLSLAELSRGRKISWANLLRGGLPWPLGEWLACRNEGRAGSREGLD